MSEGLFLFLETFIIIIIKLLESGGHAEIFNLHFDVVGEVVDNSDELNDNSDEVNVDAGEVI